MRQRMAAVLMLTLAATPAAAQTSTPGEAECRAARERLAGHAALSAEVRRSLAVRAAAYPAPKPAAGGAAATAPAPAAPATASRADQVRVRLEAITAERQRLEDARLASMVRLDFARATQIQGQMAALDAERAALEREQATLPPSAAPAPAPAPVATPAPAPAVTGLGDAERLPCSEVPSALDTAVKTRRKELGARDTQAGAVPLLALRGQLPDAIAAELAAQFAPWPGGAAQTGLLDQDGDGRLDGVVDMPARDLFRVVRLRSDGTLTVEAFAPASAAAAYSDTTRRLEESTLRRLNRRLEDVVVVRPAGSIRTTAETADFQKQAAQMLAGGFAEVARAPGAVARTVEFENLKGETVRVLDVIVPTATGVEHRQLVMTAGPGDQEVWEESSWRLKPVSYSRTDVELSTVRETRTKAGATVGPRATSGSIGFSVER